MTEPQDDQLDDRVARMRAHVLADVDADVRRRGRRTRRVLAGTAAACVVVVGGAWVGTLATGGGGQDASSAADVAAVAPDEAGDASGGSLSRTEGGTEDLSGTVAEGPGAASLGDSVGEPVEESSIGPVDPDRDVVTTGSVSVEVDDPAAAADRLAAWLRTVDGRVDSRSETDEDERDGAGAYASLTVRVPADQVDATVEELRGYGDLGAVDVSREDVTTQRVDLDARIDSLSISVQRLQDILADAESTRDLLSVETTLSQRQAELSSLEAQREALGEQVALSTLEVFLGSSDGAETPDPGGFLGGLQDGWNALVSAVDAVVVTVGVVLPWLAVVAVLTLGWLAVRRVRRRRTP